MNQFTSQLQRCKSELSTTNFSHHILEKQRLNLWTAYAIMAKLKNVAQNTDATTLYFVYLKYNQYYEINNVGSQQKKVNHQKT